VVHTAQAGRCSSGCRNPATRTQPGFGNHGSNSAARWRNLRPDVGMADRNGRVGRASGPAYGATMRFRGVPAGHLASAPRASVWTACP
jgi:hypothetical protein